MVPTENLHPKLVILSDFGSDLWYQQGGDSLPWFQLCIGPRYADEYIHMRGKNESGPEGRFERPRLLTYS